MRRTTSRVAAEKLARTAIEHPPVDVLKSPEVRRLTAEYLEIKRTSDGEGVDAVYEMGQRLAWGRGQVKGRWAAWLVELETCKSTACRYLALAEFADRHRAEFAALRSLGASKMHWVVRLSARGVRLLLSRDLAELRRLSFRSFARITRKYVRRARSRGVQPGSLAKRIRGLAHQLVDARLRSLPEGLDRGRLAHDLALLERRARALRRRL